MHVILVSVQATASTGIDHRQGSPKWLWCPAAVIENGKYNWFRRVGIWIWPPSSIMPWLRRLVSSLSPWRPGFDPRPVGTGFVVDKVAMVQVSPVTILPSQLHQSTTYAKYIRRYVRRFRRCANVIECTCANVDSIAYYTSSLYDIAYCS